MLDFLSKVCGVSPAWDELLLPTDLVPGEYALATARDGKTIVLHTKNLRSAAVVLPSLRLTRVVRTFVGPPAEERAAPSVQRFAILPRDAPACFIPGSASPLLDILRRRAEDEPDLRAALEASPPLECRTLDEANQWLADAGLYELRMVSADALRRLGTPLRRQTLLDVMNVCYLGTFAVWIKDPAAYARPNAEVLAHDVPAAAAPAAWAQPHLHTPSGNSVCAWFCYALAPSGALRLSSIVTHPGPTFRASTPRLVARDFLMWLCTCKARMTVYGFYSSFFDAQQVAALAGGGWTRLSENTLLSKLGNRVTFVDAALFAPGMLFSEYCEFWAGASVDAPQDVVLGDEPAAVAEDAALDAARALMDAATAHQAALARIFPSCDMAAFGGIREMVLANAARGCGACPMHASALSMVEAALFLEEAGEAGPDARCFRIASCLREVSTKEFPVGKPRFAERAPREAQYIALCEVERDPDVRIPVLFDPADAERLRFSRVLTSVDVETARRVGGHRVRVVAALVWERSDTVLKAGLEAQLAATRELNAPQTSNLMTRLASLPLALAGDGSPSARCSAVVRAFAASYCRRAVHEHIERVDCHFSGHFVTRHGHDRLWLRERAARHVAGAPGLQEVPLASSPRANN